MVRRCEGWFTLAGAQLSQFLMAILLQGGPWGTSSYRTGMDPDLEAANIGSTQNWASLVTVLRYIYKDICAPLLLWLYFAGWVKPVLCSSWFQEEP